MHKITHFFVSKLFWGVLVYFVNDRWYAKIRYLLALDKWGDFKNPELFTEKIQHIKLYERTELRKHVADRIKVRDYVAKKAGKQHLIPLLGNYDTFSKKIWESLPNQFVLKANHGCEMVKIVRNKKEESFDEVLKQTHTWQNTDYYKVGHEWVYKDLPRNILAEKLLLTSASKIPEDWKFFCFHGEVKIIQADFGRFGNHQHTRNLYDRNFNKMDAKLLYPQNPNQVEKPALLDEAIHLAEKLSEELNFLRVDLYITEENVYFGELTNYPGNGFIPFQPRKMEYKIGRMLHLPKQKG